MPIKLRCATSPFVFLVAIFVLATGGRLWATTVEVENEDDDISLVATPVSKTVTPQATPQNNQTMKGNLEKAEASDKASPFPSPTPQMSPTQTVKKAPLATPTSSTLPEESQTKSDLRKNPIETSRQRVRISDKVGFYYFVSAGFLVSDPSQIHSIGKVIGNPGNEQLFTSPERTYIELSSDQTKIEPGDLLVVYRADRPMHETNSATLGYRVENLAIIKVIELQRRRMLVEITQSFGAIHNGDRVETYDNETKRWKQAQIKKELPSHSIKCFVLGGDSSHQNYEQTDFIYLSAGTKAGVVEGQKFEVREITSTGAMEEPLHALRGVAQVIFAGLNYSTAQIVSNNESIEKSFEAVYQP